MAKNNIHFNLSERKLLLRVFDIVSVLLTLYFISEFFHFDYFTITKENWTWALVLVIYISVFGSIFELYDLQKSSKIEKVSLGIVITVSITVLFYLLTPFIAPVLPNNRLQILFFYFSILIALFVWRLAYITFIVSPRFHKKVLLIADTENLESIVEVFKDSDPNYKVVAFVDCTPHKESSKILDGVTEYPSKDIETLIRKEGISEIVMASSDTEMITPEIYSALLRLLEDGFSVLEYTQVYEELTQRVPVQFIGKDFYKYFPFSRKDHNKFYLLFRRLFDIVLSFFGLILGLFLLPFIMVGNLIANRGPLFYTQDRVGENGKVFKIIKYRSMIVNAEASGAVWAEKGDVRVTPFGKFLRHSRLDEFPQFINIIKGEMSLIGPRPERPVFVKTLSETLAYYDTRHIIKPGLTGWAQVNTRYASSVDDNLLKLQYDLYYIKYRNFFLDLIIIVKTISTMVFFRGQ